MQGKTRFGHSYAARAWRIGSAISRTASRTSDGRKARHSPWATCGPACAQPSDPTCGHRMQVTAMISRSRRRRGRRTSAAARIGGSWWRCPRAHFGRRYVSSVELSGAQRAVPDLVAAAWDGGL